MATLPAQTRRFKLRISAILCKNSSDLFLDTMGADGPGCAVAGTDQDASARRADLSAQQALP